MVERGGGMCKTRGAGNWHSDGVWEISWLDLILGQIGGGVSVEGAIRQWDAICVLEWSLGLLV